MTRILILAAALTAATPAAAQEVVLGFGTTRFNSPSAANATLAEIEWHSAPMGTIGRAAWHVAGVGLVTGEGDFFVGLGLGADLPLGDRGWFLQGSIAPGYYRASGAVNELGSDFEIRSAIALGYHFDSGWSLSGGVSHLSNANLGSRNPGLNVATIRFGFGY